MVRPMSREQILGKGRIDWGKENLRRLLDLPERERYELIAKQVGVDDGTKICLIYGGFTRPPKKPYYVPFAGYLIKLKEGNITGNLLDLRGPSDITGKLDMQQEMGKEIRNFMALQQRYQGKSGLIEYNFVSKGDAWVGDYFSRKYGHGRAICSIESMQDVLDSINARCGG